MNLSLLDREQLEAVLLDPPAIEPQLLQCSDHAATAFLPPPTSPRTTRIRHVLAAAHELLVRVASEAIAGRPLLDSPSLVKDFFKVMFAGAERETFVVVFVDVRMRAIAVEELFLGTVTQTAVYPREVVRRALHHNASGVLCGHPHPSGVAEPSRADEHLTQQLKAALAIVDVRLLDHLVVSGSSCVAFSERGLL